tara:strand:- start:553 stop:669 length:117 start_codon:yes stop_codon:yes gene_type:complete
LDILAIPKNKKIRPKKSLKFMILAVDYSKKKMTKIKIY